jgi:peptidoglycan glycosyltransferase
MRLERDAVTAIICLLVGFALFLAAAHADDAAALAKAKEAKDGLRGSIVDRNGVPLAVTIHGKWLTQPDVASIIGYRDPSSHWHGLEARYSAFLDATKAQGDWRTFFLHLRGGSLHGGTVRLTVDSRLQHAASRALGRSPGAVVALDPRTGAVLAMVTSPSCPAPVLSTHEGWRHCLHDPGEPLLNRATQLLLPPGSAFKIVTLSAALDTGKFALDTVFSGSDVFGPSPLFDNATYPSNITTPGFTQLTLAQALAFSDNFTFAHVGLSLGSRTLLHYAHRYYVGRDIPFELPAARSIIADDRLKPSPSELAKSAFGAEVDRVTPLQMALIAATVADHGILMAPHLVSDLETASGRVTWRYYPHTLSHVMSTRGAQAVTKGMEFVVDHGSGYLAQIAGVRVAGKTGTAASGVSNPHAWFICFAPADHPVIAVAVLHEFSGEGFKFAAPIARQVLIAALREHGMKVR